MIVKDQWDSTPLLLNYLANLLIEGRIALFLGAGISKFYGLPDWPGLIDSLYETKSEKNTETNLKIAAEEFRGKYYKNNNNGFLEAVHQALYNKVSGDFESIINHKTLAAIGALVMASSRGKVGKVITLNYDDIVELYLQYHGFTTSSIHNQVHWTPSTDVAILHPHGFLPLDKSKGFSTSLVFDQKSYSENINNNSLPWNQEISTIIRTHFVIYIGLSGDDENLDGILINTKDNHPRVNDNVLYSGIRFSTNKNRIQYFEDRGIYTKNISDFDTDIPSFLFKICQEAAKIKMK